MTNAQSGYNGLLSSWFSQSWSPISQGGVHIYLLYCCFVTVSFFFWIQCYLNYFTHKGGPNNVELGVMAMMEYSILPRSPELEPYHKMQPSVLLRTPLRGVLSLCRGNSERILCRLGGYKYKKSDNIWRSLANWKNIYYEQLVSWNKWNICDTYFYSEKTESHLKISQIVCLFGFYGISIPF